MVPSDRPSSTASSLLTRRGGRALRSWEPVARRPTQVRSTPSGVTDWISCLSQWLPGSAATEGAITILITHQAPLRRPGGRSCLQQRPDSATVFAWEGSSRSGLGIQYNDWTTIHFEMVSHHRQVIDHRRSDYTEPSQPWQTDNKLGGGKCNRLLGGCCK